MKDLFKSAVATPNIEVDRSRVLPDLTEKPNSFSSFMVEEASHPISYTIQTVNSDMYNAPIRL